MLRINSVPGGMSPPAISSYTGFSRVAMVNNVQLEEYRSTPQPKQRSWSRCQNTPGDRHRILYFCIIWQRTDLISYHHPIFWGIGDPACHEVTAVAPIPKSHEDFDNLPIIVVEKLDPSHRGQWCPATSRRTACDSLTACGTGMNCC